MKFWQAEKLSRIDFGLLFIYWFSILAQCQNVPETSFSILLHHFSIRFVFFAPISRHSPESSCIISLHSILYTAILHTEASTVLETALSKRNSGESCGNIWLTFRIIQNVTLNAELVGNVTCAVGSRSAPGSQTAVCDVGATWRESSLGEYYRDVRR